MMMSNMRAPHRLSFKEFMEVAVLRPRPADHGRVFDVFFEGRSLGFADGENPLLQAHRREVNNALYCCANGLPDLFVAGVLPTPQALLPYPSLRSKFPREFALANAELVWSEDFSSAATAEGWNLFETGAETQIQRLDEEGLLADDDEAWRIVMKGTGDHHIVARTIVFRDSPAEWARLTDFVVAGGLMQARREHASPAG